MKELPYFVCCGRLDHYDFEKKNEKPRFGVENAQFYPLQDLVSQFFAFFLIFTAFFIFETRRPISIALQRLQTVAFN